MKSMKRGTLNLTGASTIPDPCSTCLDPHKTRDKPLYPKVREAPPKGMFNREHVKASKHFRLSSNISLGTAMSKSNFGSRLERLRL